MKYLSSISPLIILVLVSLFIAPGCATQKKSQMILNINDVLVETDRQWAAINTEARKLDGMKTVEASSEASFKAAKETLDELGFNIREYPEQGTLKGNALAPTPFSLSRWELIKQHDLQQMREIAKQIHPEVAGVLQLNARKVGSQMKVTVSGTDSVSQVTIIPSIRDHNDTAGYYAMQSTPPMATKAAIALFWSVFEEKIGQ